MIGQTVSHYRIVQKLGGGGMGVVFKAEDTRLKRPVALKFLPADLTRDDDAKERFIQEAQAASVLDHPNICTIYEIDETADGQMFLAMGYCEGETLKKRLERGPQKIEDALDIAMQVAQGLMKAHVSGIVHRDIKPANLMISPDGLVKVVDFGLAKFLGQTGLTRPGTALGTVSYMAPEQALARDVDHRADIWALGVVLFEMVTGQVPFKGENQLAIANGIVQMPAPAVTSLRSGVPLDLERVINRALAKLPDDRYQTLADFHSELRRIRRELDSQSAAPGSLAGIASATGLTPVPGSGAMLLPSTSGMAAPSGAGTPSVTHPSGVVTATPPTAQASWPPGQSLPLSGQSSQLPARSSWLPPSGGRLMAAAVGIVAVASGAYWLMSRDASPSPIPRLSNPAQLTMATGIETYATWSPDGRAIAYMSLQSGNWDIWVMQLGSGQPVNRTADNRGDDLYPAWSPDGSEIAFSSDRDGGGVFLVSPLGGIPRRVPVKPRNCSLAWSPDGRTLACAARESGVNYVELASLATGNSTRVPLPGRDPGRYMLTWSPDGQWLAYVTAVDVTADVTQLWIVHLPDGKAFPASEGLSNDWSPTWSTDSRTLYFVSNRGGSMDLWQQPVAADGPRPQDAVRVTTGLGIMHAAFSPDGKRLTYAKGQAVANVWRVPILPDREATWADAQQLTSDQALIQALDVSRDGKRLILNSNRSGNQDIWTLPAEGGDLQQETTHPTPDWGPRWSPNAAQIAMYAYRGGSRDIWVMPSSGSGAAARQLTRNPGSEMHPAWSPDGKQLVFQSDQSGNWDIWKIAADGGEPYQMTTNPASDTWPMWTPDGQAIVFYSTRAGRGRIFRQPITSESAVALTEDGIRSKFTPDGKLMVFSASRDRVPALVGMAPDGGPERRLAILGGRRGSIVNHATDGRFVYFSWQEDSADLWVMDVTR